MDTRFDPLPSILQYVEGKAWYVDYFQQVVGNSDELSPQQTNVSAPFQQYRRIREFELKVTTALRPTQDEQSKSMIIEGEATVWPLFIPNAGDSFLADIGDGREGIFQIVTSVKKTHLKESLYQITYVLKGYSDTLGSALEDLEEKTVEDVHFVKDYLAFGQNPVLMTADYNYRIEFGKALHELVDYYMHEMFSVQNQTLIIPDQELRTYDPFLTRFITNLLTAQDHPYIGRIHVPSVDGQLITRHPTIWDVILEMNDRLLSTVVHRVRLIDSSVFRAQPLFAGVYYAGIKRVVFPFDARTDADGDYALVNCPSLLATVLLKNGKNRWNTLERLISDMEWEGLTLAQLQEPEHPPVGVDALPDIVAVTADDYYVLTERLYRERKPSSKLEHLLLRFLRDEETDKALLLRLAQRSVSWRNLERYYYQPIIIALLIAAMRRN